MYGRITVFILTIFLILAISFRFAIAKDMCKDLVVYERNAHIQYFGPSFPWWDGVGQIKQESACRENVTAFDKGQGVAQFMPDTKKFVEHLMGKPFNSYNAKEAINAQAFYMYYLYKQNKIGTIWSTYQGYNGGFAPLYSEYKKAGVADYNKMRKVCHRKVITLKGGKKLDMCDVNYSYPKNIYKYGKEYQIGPEIKPFW